MANHKSSKKRMRQTIVRRARNRTVMSTMKTEIKKVTAAVAAKDFGNMDVLLRNAQSVIAKTRQKGVIHKNKMARIISRLNRFVAKNRADAA